jgi:hypothetical protein
MLRPEAKKVRMLYLQILSGIALIVSVLWAVAKPGYDSMLAVVVSFSGLLGLFVANKKKSPQLRQSVSKSSVGVQAGGDVIIGAISRDEHAE